MNDKITPPEFWVRADEVIALVNKQLNDTSVGQVSSSLLYAAARFNSFAAFCSAETAEELLKDRENSIKYFTEQISS